MGTQQSDNPISLEKQIQMFLQSILSISSVIYLVGFLVVNSYYTTLGITSYQLVQTRYISAGLSFVFIHFSIAILVAVIFVVLELSQRVFFWFLSFICLWVALATVIYRFSVSIINSTLVGINAGIIVLLAFQVGLIFTKSQYEWLNKIWVLNKSQAQWRSALLGVGVVILFCVGSLSWGFSTWPYVSATLGGGRPSEAVFVLDEKALPIDGIPLLPMQTESISKQISLVYEDSDGYVVLVGTGLNSKMAMRLSKSIVKSIIYAPIGIAGKKQEILVITP